MLIRKAILSDLPQIMQLIGGVLPVMIASGNFQWDDSYPNAEIFTYDISLNQLWIVEIAGAIGGIAAITSHQEAEYAKVGWNISVPAIVIHRLAVNINFQGMGIAAVLLKQAEQVAIASNIHLLRVDTNSANQATQKLFPKFGYRYAGEISLEFRPGLKFYCYEKQI